MVPSQLPPQLLLSVAQAVRPPWGAPPAGTGEHVPARLATSHASHWPRHAELQQTPSTQLPLAQSPASTQAPPAGSLSTHLLAAQYWSAVQALQSPSHKPPEQVEGAHSTGVPVRQLPVPLQTPWGVAVVPAQLGVPQLVLA